MFGCGAIQTQAQAFHAMFFQSSQHLTRERRRRGGRNRYADTQFPRFIDQFVQIGTRQRIAP